MPWSRPLGETRPAWKVMRVIANLLGLPGFDFESAQEVLMAARGAQDAQATHVQGGKLSNATSAAVDASGRRRQAGHGCDLPARQHCSPRTVAAADGRCPCRQSAAAGERRAAASARASSGVDEEPESVGALIMIDQIYGFGNGLISAGWWTGAAWPAAWALIKIIVLVAPLMGAVAYLTLWERKAISFTQIRIGPNRIGPSGPAAADRRRGEADDQGNHPARRWPTRACSTWARS